mgnify:CR=1 FL=1
MARRACSISLDWIPTVSRRLPAEATSAPRIPDANVIKDSVTGILTPPICAADSSGTKEPITPSRKSSFASDILGTFLTPSPMIDPAYMFMNHSLAGRSLTPNKEAIFRLSSNSLFINNVCSSPIKLAKVAIKNNADYIALGAFNSSRTKNIKYRATINDLKKFRKLTKKPIIAIGGINDKNYKKLLLNKADFLAISSFIWRNKKMKPEEAVRMMK